MPPELTVTVHTCRGNFKSTWMASGGYEPVAETVFNRLQVAGFFLEYDPERAGGFAPLRFMPRGKKVVRGLVSSKFPDLENKDDLKRRIDAAAQYVPLDDLCLSPQCGFSSTPPKPKRKTPLTANHLSDALTAPCLLLHEFVSKSLLK